MYGAMAGKPMHPAIDDRATIDPPPRDLSAGTQCFIGASCFKVGAFFDDHETKWPKARGLQSEPEPLLPREQQSEKGFSKEP